MRAVEPNELNAQLLSREHGAVDVTKHISVVDTHGAKIICVFPFLNNDLVGFAHGIFEARMHNPARDNSGLGMERLPGRDAKRRFNFQVWLHGKSSQHLILRLHEQMRRRDIVVDVVDGGWIVLDLLDCVTKGTTQKTEGPWVYKQSTFISGSLPQLGLILLARAQGARLSSKNSLCALTVYDSFGTGSESQHQFPLEGPEHHSLATYAQHVA